jgi:hypothetical protein
LVGLSGFYPEQEVVVNIIDALSESRKSARKHKGTYRVLLYHDGMTSPEFATEDIEKAYKKFSDRYEHEVIMNAIGALQVIGYTVIAPFINESHIRASKDVSESFWQLEDNSDINIDDEVIVAMCAFTLAHMKYRDDIATIIRDRRVTSVDDMKHLLRVMRKVSEPLD